MPTLSFKVEDEHGGTRLDVYLTKNLPDHPSRTFVKKLIDQQCVKINNRSVKAHHKVIIGEEIIVDYTDQDFSPSKIEAEEISLNIIYEDDFIVVINKPAGMLVHPAQNHTRGTLVNALLGYCKQLSSLNNPERPGIVHRLDQETSGIMVIAKDNATHAALAKQFENRKIKKEYIAIVEGKVEFEEGIIDAPIGRHPKQRDKKSIQYDDSAKASVTHYQVIERFENKTLIKLMPKTGRTHQLRVHLAHIGHPILGDAKYGKKSNFSRLALHACSIGIHHPHLKKFVKFETEIPEELKISQKLNK